MNELIGSLSAELAYHWGWLAGSSIKVTAWLLDRERFRTTEGKLDLNTERAKLARAQSEKVGMENAVKSGELVKTDIVVSAAADLARNVIEGIYSFQDRLASRIDVKTQKHIRRDLDRVINRIAQAAENAADKMDPEGHYKQKTHEKIN
jgi:phage terminase Nu1 subunit (DNA packaging protein)